MIQANELRIGNWIAYYHPEKQDPIHDQVQFILPDEEWSNGKLLIGFERRSARINICGLMPIPLTPEILVKCGFSKSSTNDWFIRWPQEDITLRFYNGKLFWQPDYELIPVDDRWEVKTLHQLQNILHALTGEELNYQP